MLPSPFVILPVLLTTAWAAGAVMRPTVSGFLTESETLEATSTVAETETTTAASGATTYTVNVGASGHKFTPAEVKAKVGDVIEWRFYPSGHWIIRGDFEHPCIPYEYVDLDRTGFSSGAQKVQAITDDAPRFRARVNNTDPIFFYCGAPGSCVKYHMMGVVNPSQNETLDKWLEKAKDVDYQLRPGEPWPTEDLPSETASPKGSDREDDDDDAAASPHLSPGAIAGIAIGSAAVLLLAGALLYLCGRRGGFDKAYRKSFRGTPNPPVAETPFNSPAAASPWDANKGLVPGVVAAPFGQSPPMSPHQSVGYGTHPAALAAMVAQAQDGTIGSYYSDTYTQHPVAPSPSHGGTTPKPPEQTSPAELPASADPGNSPLPTYNNNNNDGQPGRVFSWAGEEAGYRPTK